MLVRLTHAAIAFAVTAAAYQGYVLVAAPLVDPTGAADAAGLRALTHEELLAMSGGVDKYRPLLAAYFPADHWLLAPGVRPIVLENNQALLAFDEYRQTDGGSLSVPRVAAIVFPRPRNRSAEPPRDAIILEPERGASLQLDQALGQGFSAMGRLQYGQLLGAVRIRSDMQQPGPDDDLQIETRDLYMNEDLIRTTETVEMSFGPHRARGRGLEIRFARREAAPAVGGPSLLSKLDTLEISQEVAARFVPQETTLFGQPVAAGNNRPGAAPQLPAEISSSGPFRIDFANRVASFAENVQVRQRQADGRIDQLQAHLLTLYFAELRQWGGATAEDAEDGPGLLGSIKLEPATLEAVGSPETPLTLTAPSHDAAAQGDRLTIGLIQRLVTLEGSQSLSVSYQGAEVRAPVVQYELPAKDSGARLGTMSARGRGSLRAVPNPQRPAEVLEVRWMDSMHLVRRAGQPVLILDGRPRVSMIGLGTLYADQLEIHLRESPAGAPATSPLPGGAALPVAVDAERIAAIGHVGIDSAELTGQVNQLDLRIAYPSTAPGAAAAQGGAGRGGPAAAGGSPRGMRQTGPQRRSYRIVGDLLSIQAEVRQRQPTFTALRISGGVQFEETTPAAGGAPPLRIRAEQVDVAGADAEDTTIEIRGGDPRGGMAEIGAGTTVLRAPAVRVRRGANEARIDAPGEVQMTLLRDLSGQPLARPEPLAITWRDSLHLLGDRITVLGNVHVQHGDDWLRTDKLVAVLTAPVQFDSAGAGDRPEPEVAQVECWGGARAEFLQRDATGAVTSLNRFEAASLSVNQVSGRIAGDGPGRLDSVHYSRQGASMLALPTGPGAAAPPPASADVPKLRHLNLEFARGLAGNLLARDIAAEGDIRTVYGPVNSWEERLSMTPGGRPGPETLWITCDRLAVAESPLGRLQNPTTGLRREMGPIELQAQGNVEIELDHPQRGAVWLRGDEASFDQLKSMFTLRGSSRRLATITNQQYPGAPPSEAPAEGFIFYQNTGEVKLISPRGQFWQFDGVK